MSMYDKHLPSKNGRCCCVSDKFRLSFCLETEMIAPMQGSGRRPQSLLLEEKPWVFPRMIYSIRKVVKV